ncbi:MAG: hypothetical protein JXM69_17470 [Anaerolineae bacterium]|nr:hypothetical protein [Anaerolineae bacterium]
MSKNWKIAIGVIIIIVGLVGLGMLRWGHRVYWSSGGERGWSLGAYAYQVFGWDSANYLADFSRGPVARRDTTGLTSEVEVRLIDDNGDGVPDWGVIELPAKDALERRFALPDRGTHLGRNFGPGHRPFRPIFVSLFIIGGLVSLAFLALIVGLGIFFYRRWRANHSPAPVNVKAEE